MPASNVRYGLKTLPRTEFGDGFGVRALDIEAGIITAAHLDASFALPVASIAQGALVPDKIGLPFTNKTGGTLTKGTLVYHNSWDTSTSLPTMAKAAASTYATAAAWIVLADVINNASGTVGQHLSLTAQNTNAANVGDPVYLHTTAGTYSLTVPAVGEYYQQIGTVSVKSATVGVVEMRIMAQPALQALARLQVAMPTIATTGAVSGRLIMPNNARVLGFKGIFKDALATDNTNYISWTVTNLGQASGGTTVMLATSPAGINTTKTTGGTAIAVNTAWVFTVSSVAADMVVVGGDMLLITATSNGTLANTVTEGVVSAVYAPA